jgi:hypothetical protein
VPFHSIAYERSVIAVYSRSAFVRNTAANWMPVVELWNLANAHTISRVQHPNSNVAAAFLNYKPFLFFLPFPPPLTPLTLISKVSEQQPHHPHFALCACQRRPTFAALDAKPPAPIMARDD